MVVILAVGCRREGGKAMTLLLLLIRHPGVVISDELLLLLTHLVFFELFGEDFGRRYARDLLQLDET